MKLSSNGVFVCVSADAWKTHRERRSLSAENPMKTLKKGTDKPDSGKHYTTTTTQPEDPKSHEHTKHANTQTHKKTCTHTHNSCLNANTYRDSHTKKKQAQTQHTNVQYTQHTHTRTSHIHMQHTKIYTNIQLMYNRCKYTPKSSHNAHTQEYKHHKRTKHMHKHTQQHT